MFFISALIALAPISASLPPTEDREASQPLPKTKTSRTEPAAPLPDLCLAADRKTPADKYDYAACNAGDRLSADRWMLQVPAKESSADPR